MLKVMTAVLYFAVSALPLTVAQLAPALGGPYGGETDCASMAELVAFVADETDYPPLRNCPRVRVTNNEVLRAILALNASAHGAEPLAAYSAASAEILLGPEIVLTTPLGQSYLVHDLVHAHQFADAAPARAPCVGWLEGEAYRVQASYLRRQDLAQDAFAFELLGLLQSACAHAYHP